MRYYSDVKPNDMKNRIFFLLLFFVCLEWNAYAVIDIQSIHITSSDGLANNTIRDIFQDKKGFIWISTTNGLSRYDGHSFMVGSINSIFYFLHKAAEPFNCLEQDNLA